MATKTLTITEEAYRRLAGLKNERDSFSDVIVREIGKHKLREIYGILSGKAGEELEKSIKERRDKHREIRKKRHSEMLKNL